MHFFKLALVHRFKRRLFVDSNLQDSFRPSLTVQSLYVGFMVLMTCRILRQQSSSAKVKAAPCWSYGEGGKCHHCRGCMVRKGGAQSVVPATPSREIQASFGSLQISMEDTAPHDVDSISTQVASRVAQRIVQCMSNELRLLPGPLCHQVVMEKIL